MDNKARKIAFSGLLIAISVILTRFFAGNVMLAGVYSLRISFGEIPILLSGILFGPFYGLVTGALSDIIGFTISPMGGAYFPGFTVTAALTGFIPGLLITKRQVSWLSLLAVIALTDVLTSMALNTLWLSMLYHKGFLVLLPGRMITRIILIPIYTMMVKSILKYTSHVIPDMR